MDELFGELRSMMQAAAPLDVLTLTRLLKVAHESDPVRYQEAWRPYLASFSLPEIEVKSFDGLSSLATLFPENLPCVLSIVREFGYGDERLRRGLLYSPVQMLVSLTVKQCSLTLKSAQEIANCAELEHVTYLDCSNNMFGDEGVTSLVHSSHLDAVSTLNLSGVRMTSKCARIIARSEMSKRLTRLELGFNDIALKGSQTFSKCPHFVGLERLGLGSCSLGDHGVGALSRSPFFESLTALNLHSNRLGVVAMRSLHDSMFREQLVFLELRNNRIDDDAFRALINGAMWTKLAHLDVRHNRLTEASVDTILTMEHLTDMRTLRLGNNPLGAGFLSTLLDRRTPLALETLVLNNTGVSTDDILALSKAECLPHLKRIELGYNSITRSIDLKRSKTLPRGLHIDLRGNPCVGRMKRDLIILGQ